MPDAIIEKATMTDAIIEKVTIWLFFGVALGLLPILFDAVKGMMNGLADPFGSAIDGGELALVTAVICGAAIGELFGVGGPAHLAKIIAGGCALLTLTFSSFFYAQVAAAVKAGVVPVAFIRTMSVLLYTVGIISSGICVALSQVK